MLSEPVRYGDFSADVLKGDLLVASARDESELVYTIPNFPEGVRERGPRAKWLVLHVQYHGEGTFSGLVVPVERKRLTVDEVFRSGVWYASETALAVIVRECRIDPDRVRSSEKFIDECPGWLKDFELPLPPPAPAEVEVLPAQLWIPRLELWKFAAQRESDVSIINPRYSGVSAPPLRSECYVRSAEELAAILRQSEFNRTSIWGFMFEEPQLPVEASWFGYFMPFNPDDPLQDWLRETGRGYWSRGGGMFEPIGPLGAEDGESAD